ncbi:hypothetical protein LINPERHAP1_LOCUS28069 [Linum perenne]
MMKTRAIQRRRHSPSANSSLEYAMVIRYFF